MYYLSLEYRVSLVLFKMSLILYYLKLTFGVSIRLRPYGSFAICYHQYSYCQNPEEFLHFLLYLLFQQKTHHFFDRIQR